MAKIFSRNLFDKHVMGADGTEIGTLYNMVIDIRTGDLIDLVIKPDMALDTTNFRIEDKFVLIPFESVRAVKDYIVVEKRSAL